MSPTGSLQATRTEELSPLLESVLRESGGRGGLADLRRRPSAYRTSFAIEEIEAVFGDGSTLTMIAKDLGFGALHDLARSAKPAFLHAPTREIEVYRHILPSAPLGSPTCHGAVVDYDRERYWLFLERAPALELYQVGEFEVWEEVARQLAGLHRWGRLAGPVDRTHELIVHSPGLYRLWIRRAWSFLGKGSESRPPRVLAEFNRLGERYDEVVDRLTGMESTFLHGEFYPSNILVAGPVERLRVCPVDWEMAAVGPGLLDLAALVAGGWSEGEKRRLALAYRAALYAGADRSPGEDDFLEALDWCRLHLAVQWLGWSARWSPPAEHAHDWLREALRLARRLNLV